MDPSVQSSFPSSPFALLSTRGQWLKDFTDAIAWKAGIDGDGKSAYYMCLEDQRVYWEDHLHEGLQACKLTADLNTILPQHPQQASGYTRIWSTLSYIGLPEFIDDFISANWDDASLPLKETSIGSNNPFSIPTPNPHILEMLSRFHRYQWIFNPLQLYKDRDFPSKRKLEKGHILPVRYIKELSPQGADNWGNSRVHLVQMNDDCSDLSQIVFKEYTGAETVRFWNRELDVLNSLGRLGGDHIIKCFGSFDQNGKCVVMLEYMEDGTLAEFFLTADRPTTPPQLETFFNSLFDLCKALCRLRDEKTLAHGDLKPSNIFLARNRNSDDPWDFSLKIADFDRSAKIHSETTRINDMTLAYSCPEASSVYDFQQGAGIKVPSNGDIWSLGAIISEALVWCHRGKGLQGGLAAYSNRREKELEGIHGMSNSGYDGCFHNGNGTIDFPRLRCVEDLHQEALRYGMGGDYVSNVVKRTVEKYILVNQRSRLTPEQVYHHYSQDILEAKKGYDDTPGSGRPGSSPISLASPTSPDSRSQRTLSVRTSDSSYGTTPEWCQHSSPRRRDHHRHSNFSSGSPPSSTPIRMAKRQQRVDNPPVWPDIEQPQQLAQGSSSQYRETAPPGIHHPSAQYQSSTLELSNHAKGDITSNQEGLPGLPDPGLGVLQPDNFHAAGGSGQASPSGVATVPRPYTMISDTSATYHPPTRLRLNVRGAYTAKSLPHLSIQDVLSAKQRKGKVEALSGYSEATEFLQTMSPNGRDIVFLVDDSGSMAKLAQEVSRSAKALLWLTKGLDKDGADLYFTSASKASLRKSFSARVRRSTTYLADEILSHCPKSERGSCNMEQALSTLLTKLYQKNKATSLYVLTNGIWDPEITEVGGGGEGPILRLAHLMAEDKRDRGDLTIQFIRFDNTPDSPERDMAIRRLKYLDDFLSSKTPNAFGGGNFDMVDHKLWTDPMWPQVLGALYKGTDMIEAGGSASSHLDSFLQPSTGMNHSQHRTSVIE
ncbi:hypothetical protein MKZ38_001748 [Zalerion maritima]|uniref:non-specific serine/threonine protein kinase n=1 Tax=Zalerion maritima TaxID=339359 RepID=A0AAD5WWX7_9PEZI|nr:hypothetical protein MKZ38_001748 [Zalerion maritima]